MKHLIAALIGIAVFSSAATGSQAGGGGTGSISLDARDLDIYDVVRLIATEAGVNVVVDASVSHRPITLRVVGMRLEDALNTLAQTNDLEVVRVGKVIYLGASETMNRRYPSRAGGIVTHVFELRVAAAADVAKALTDALPRGTVIVPDARTASVLVSGSPSTLERAKEIALALDGRDSIRSRSFAMHFAKAADVAKSMQTSLAVVPPQAVNANDDQNAVLVAGGPAFLDQAAMLIDKLDRPGRQVRYDIQVTDIEPQNDTGNIGFLYGGVTPAAAGSSSGGAGGAIGQAVLTFPIKTVAIDATLNALVTQGRAQVLARPNIATMNNVPASLLVGEQYPIVYFDARTGTQQVQFINVGVNLNVTPTIGDDGDIITDLETDYSQIVGTAAGGFPRVGTRRAQSRLRVHDGETIVIAGLFSDFDSTTISKVPFLSEIPVLGEFFKNRQYSRSKDEVVFLLTPHIVTEANIHQVPFAPK